MINRCCVLGKVIEDNAEDEILEHDAINLDAEAEGKNAALDKNSIL